MRLCRCPSRHKGRVAAIAFSIAFAISFFRAAHASEHASARLVYLREESAASCPDASALTGAVAERLGYVPFSNGAPTAVVVSVRHDAAKWHGAIQYVDAGGAILGEREIDSTAADCSDLATSMAFTIALFLDPDSSLAPHVSEPPKDAPKVAPTPPTSWKHDTPFEPRAPSNEKKADDARNVISGAAGVGVIGNLGLAPAPSVGSELYVSFTWRSLSIGVDGDIDLPASTTTSSGVGASSWLAAGSLVPCYVWRPFDFCALGSLGVLTADGEGANAVRTHLASALIVAFGARVAAEIPIGARFFVRLHVDVLVPSSRTRIEVGGEDVWTMPVVTASAGAAAAIHLF